MAKIDKEKLKNFLSLTDTETLAKMKQILTFVDEDVVSKKDFENNFKRILRFLTKLKKKNTGQFSDLGKSQEERLEKIRDENNLSISKVKEELNELIGIAIKKIEDDHNFLKDKAVSIRDFTDGIDGYAPIKGIDYFDGSPDTPDVIANKLETLKDKGRLKIEAILDLEKRLKELEERPIGRGGVMGGGVGKLALEAKFVDNELIGTGDGTTTEFTLKSIPNPIASLKIVVGAGELFLADDWTISGKTITFLTAPPDGAKVRGSHRK